MSADLLTFHANVLSALRQHAMGTVGFPGISSVAWENRGFRPPGGERIASDAALPDDLWIGERYAPGPLEEVGFGDRILLRSIGVYFLDVFARRGEGTRAAWAMAGELLARFHPKSDIAYDGQVVVLRRVYASRGREDAAYYQVPVTIEWRADVLSPS